MSTKWGSDVSVLGDVKDLKYLGAAGKARKHRGPGATICFVGWDPVVSTLLRIAQVGENSDVLNIHSSRFIQGNIWVLTLCWRSYIVR